MFRCLVVAISSELGVVGIFFEALHRVLYFQGRLLPVVKGDLLVYSLTSAHLFVFRVLRLKMSTSMDPHVSSTTSHTVFYIEDYTHPYHPLYVHPFDVLGASFVSFLFDGTRFGSWRRTILVALSVQNKLEFIDGSSSRPSDSSPLARLAALQ